MGVSDKVLKANVLEAIRDIEASQGKIDCAGHPPLAKGMKVLLEIQQAVIEEKEASKNSIKIGNFTVQGTASIAIVVAGYCILKQHGVI